MNIPDNILPVLRVAQAAAAGNPVPGLNDVVALAEMVSAVTPRFISLGKKSKSKQYGKELQDIKAAIASHIQDFTFHNNISIKIIVDQISTSQENPRPTKKQKLNNNMAGFDQVDTSLQRMEPQDKWARSHSVDNHGDRQGPGGGNGAQGQNLTVNNYISGVGNHLGTNMIIHFSQEVLVALVDGALHRVPAVVGVLARVPL
ncbi:hypothetical protein B0H14DRAFT_2585332 [Mycena olivaceomarginata]|nr:hypothetical protein B0H14DRAFT_2585332 [Mycena olivaceomarginata]